jgi:hypothetical protein
VDRERAQSNIKGALLAASIAVGAFGFTFIVAILYIG